MKYFDLLVQLQQQLHKDAQTYRDEGKDLYATIALVVSSSISSLYLEHLKRENAVLRIETDVMLGLKEMLDRGEHP